MLNERSFQEGQIEPVDILDDSLKRLGRDNVEAGVDGAEHEVKVSEDDLAPGRLGEGRREIDGQRRAADPPRSARDGDHLRPFLR